MIRVALLGNMNNMSFSLCRYLRDLGYDAQLYVFPGEGAHFGVSNDTYSKDYENYVHLISWGDPADFFKWNKKEIKKTIEQYDFIIGCGPAPAIMYWLGKKLDLFIPYGFDIFHLPRLRLVSPRNIIQYTLISLFQKWGIKAAYKIIFDRANPEYEEIVADLITERQRVYICPPMLYQPEYESDKLLARPGLNQTLLRQMQELRASNDLIIVHCVRHEWLPEHNFKNNDKLVLAYNNLIRERPSLRSKLLLFEYGPDRAATRQLINSLGLTDEHVIWFPTMPRKDIMLILYFSDLAVGELLTSWLTYGCASEAMAMKKPLLHCRNDEDFKDTYDTLYPMLHGNDEGSVRTGIEAVIDNPEKYKKMGIESHVWFQKYCVAHAIKTIDAIIRQKMTAGNI